MSQRKHRSPSQWKALIEKQLSSGLTGVAFCNEHGLSAKTFYKQRKHLGYAGRSGAGVSSGGFVQVQPVASSISSKPLILRYRDSRLELSSEVSPQWVAELMRALA